MLGHPTLNIRAAPAFYFSRFSRRFRAMARILAFDRKEWSAVEHHVEWFQFTLPVDQTIGPEALRALWMRACGSTNVSVQRNSRTILGRRTPVYSLRASARLGGLAVIEARLRGLMQEARLNSKLTAVVR
nr:hypothetical protein [Lysobacter enzymogenes]